MLNMYQLWLDDLYPRAKFADALAIIEKVGHTKRIQVDRKAWIDEGKPRRPAESDEDELDANVPDEAPAQDRQEATEGSEVDRNPALTQSRSEVLSQPRDPSHAVAEEPDEDELDALLAETAPAVAPVAKKLPSQLEPTQNDPFADEMEAMEGMDDLW